MMEELLYFEERALPDQVIEELVKGPSIALLLKRSAENLPTVVDDVICQMVYGNSRKPPGDKSSLYRKLLTVTDGIEIPALWTPLNCLAKAMGLKRLFHSQSAQYFEPPPPPPPLHIALGFDAFKYRNLIELEKKYPGQIMHCGFFTTDVPGTGKLIAKTFEKFEARQEPPTYEEKVVIQLNKTISECVEAFKNLHPSYSSPDGVQGEEDCKYFFPSDYELPEESVTEVKKKSKRKKKAANVVQDDTSSQATENLAEYICENENENGDFEETVLETTTLVENEADDEDDLEGKDKATSPMQSGRNEE